MSNPFSPLVRMLELRKERQLLALKETESQLDAAIISRNQHEYSGKQVDIGEQIARTVSNGPQEKKR